MSCFAELQGQFLLTSINASRVSGEGICAGGTFSFCRTVVLWKTIQFCLNLCSFMTPQLPQQLWEAFPQQVYFKMKQKEESKQARKSTIWSSAYEALAQSFSHQMIGSRHVNMVNQRKY